MFKNMINAISNPKSVFLRIKDKAYTILIYILLLSFIMTLPVILKAIVNKESLFASRDQINKEIYHILDEEVVIEDNKLITTSDIKFNVGMYVFTVGNPKITEIGYIISLEKEEVIIYFSSGQGVLIRASSTSYEKLGVGNLEFTNENKTLVTNLLINSFVNSPKIIALIVIEALLSNVFNILFIAMFLALLASMSRKIPLKYSYHFKANVYLATIYAFIMLILNLFNLGALSLIALIVVYFYHFRVYSTVRLIPKVKGGDNSE